VATATASPLVTTTYTVTGTSLGCSATAVSTVTVNPLPTATVSGGGSVCFGNPTPSVVITFTGTGPWNFTYTDGTTFTALVTPTSPYTIVNPPAGTYTVTNVSDANCTGTFSGSAPVVINPLPVPTFTGPTNGCVPYCETFVNTSTIASGSITGYNWNFGNGILSTSNQQNPTYCYNNIGTYSVTLTDTSNFGCIATVTSTNFITVYPVPVAAFSCPQVHSIIFPNIQFTNYSTGATGYTWDFGDIFNPTTNTSTQQNPTHLYSELGSYCVLLTVTNGHCIDTTEICLLIEPEFTFYIPNAFTPDGDGTNDEFFGKGEGILEYEMKIYDRWGENIFTGNALDQHWDGTYAGNLVQQDVYVYVVTLKDIHHQDHKYIGSVTVVR
jgi:gliding motility-associated-like protein